MPVPLVGVAAGGIPGRGCWIGTGGGAGPAPVMPPAISVVEGSIGALFRTSGGVGAGGGVAAPLL